MRIEMMPNRSISTLFCRRKYNAYNLSKKIPSLTICVGQSKVENQGDHRKPCFQLWADQSPQKLSKNQKIRRVTFVARPGKIRFLEIWIVCDVGTFSPCRLQSRSIVFSFVEREEHEQKSLRLPNSDFPILISMFDPPVF